jgi:hypothetical protein
LCFFHSATVKFPSQLTTPVHQSVDVQSGSNLGGQAKDDETIAAFQQRSQTSVSNLLSGSLDSNSTSPSTSLVLLEEPSASDIGKWCIVKYDGKPYPGIIIDVDVVDWNVEVKTMHSVGRNRFFWPTMIDRVWYTQDNFLSLIPEPSPIGTRHLQVNPQMYAHIEHILDL